LFLKTRLIKRKSIKKHEGEGRCTCKYLILMYNYSHRTQVT
jgi:hypothetical protein